jgi:hypothetical protein
MFVIEAEAETRKKKKEIPVRHVQEAIQMLYHKHWDVDFATENL